MKIPFYQIDAFTGRVFAGNPAGVCFLDVWIDADLMQAIAAENNLSETAFLVGAAGQKGALCPAVVRTGRGDFLRGSGSAGRDRRARRPVSDRDTDGVKGCGDHEC